MGLPLMVIGMNCSATEIKRDYLKFFSIKLDSVFKYNLIKEDATYDLLFTDDAMKVLFWAYTT